MKIGICDDSAKDREHLETLCRSLGYSDLYLYSSGEELLQSPELPSLTLLFLDIKMEGMNGIEVKDKMEHSAPTTFIAFCTAHQEEMRSAFGIHVISFLSKPLTKDTANGILHKVTLLSRNSIPLKIDNKNTVRYHEILYLKSEQKYTVFHTIYGRKILSRKSLKNWVSELTGFDFCPVSRSAAINLRHYEKQDHCQVFLYGGSTIPVSRRYLQTLKEAVDTYMGI